MGVTHQRQAIAGLKGCSRKENSGAVPLDQLQGFLFCGDSALQGLWMGSCSHEQR